MAQQPNIELDPSDRPRSVPSPGAARRWTPSKRPGVITSPSEKPSGAGFGTPGPDAGWAMRLIAQADLPDSSEELASVLAALMGARASEFGRAPTMGDFEAALALCGIGEGYPDHIAERRERWKRATSHDKPKGSTALAEIDRDLLLETPERIRVAMIKR